MKLRQHRGGLAESMETVVEIEPTKDALMAAVHSVLSRSGFELTDDMLHVEPYAFDSRIQWDAHIVTIDGYGVYGFTDGPLGAARRCGMGAAADRPGAGRAGG